MFTGIITDVGRIAAIERHGDIRFLVETSFDTSTIAIGASIAHNGCCLTVIETQPGRYSVEVSAETLATTTLGALRAEGRRVGKECVRTCSSRWSTDS